MSEAKNNKLKLNYIGLIDNQFKYKVQINDHWFDFQTGIGWVSWDKKNTDSSQYVILNDSETDLVKSEQPRKSWTRDDWQIKCYRRQPTEADILECLKSDAEAGRMSFSDFCDNFGYSNDSLKALNIYRQCEDTASKLRGFEFPDTEKNEL